jgi:hypothetical protein
MLISWLQNVWLRLLKGQTIVLVLVAAAVGAGLAAGVPPVLQWLEGRKPTPTPAPLVDRTFIPVGRTYLSALGQQYGAAWVQGAQALESGQSVPSALKSVAQSWDLGRTQLFGRLLTPEFAKIVPEGQSDSEAKAADRLALARAWRGLAAGLTARSWLP